MDQEGQKARHEYQHMDRQHPEGHGGHVQDEGGHDYERLSADCARTAWFQKNKGDRPHGRG